MTEDGDDAVVPVVEVAADGHDREQQERRHEGDERGEDEHALLGLGGHQVFLEEELDAVGEGLEDAEGARLVGPDPVGHVGVELALEPDHEHRRDEQQHEDDDDLAEDDEEHAPGDVTREQGVVGEERGEGRGGHDSPPESMRRSVTR